MHCLYTQMRALAMEGNQQLKAKVVYLEERVAQLERETSCSPVQLERQLLALLSPERSAYHGPATITQFESFGVQDVIDEMLQFSILVTEVT